MCVCVSTSSWEALNSITTSQLMMIFQKISLTSMGYNNHDHCNSLTYWHGSRFDSKAKMGSNSIKNSPRKKNYLLWQHAFDLICKINELNYTLFFVEICL